MGQAKKTPEQLEVGAYITDYLSRRAKKKERGGTETYEEIAADLELSTPHISNVLNGHNEGTGPQLADAVARKLFGGSTDRLRAEAKAWCKKNNVTPTAITTNPELAAAITYMRGFMPPEFLEEWLSAKSDVDWTGVNREGFRKMIEGDFETKRRSGAASRMESARAKKFQRKPTKRA